MFLIELIQYLFTSGILMFLEKQSTDKGCFEPIPNSILTFIVTVSVTFETPFTLILVVIIIFSLKLQTASTVQYLTFCLKDPKIQYLNSVIGFKFENRS